MPHTLKGWWKPIRLLVLFYALFLVAALTASDHGDPALVVWRISVAVSALMALVGLLGSWRVVAHGKGKVIYPILELSGIWSLALIEAYHALYVGPIQMILHGDNSMDGRATVHLILAIAIFLVARRKMRFGRVDR